MRREAVSSRAMKTVGYRAGTLEIEFPDGDVYRYFGVPPLLFLQFLRAESMGAFFNVRIRDRFRVEGPLPPTPVAGRAAGAVSRSRTLHATASCEGSEHMTDPGNEASAQGAASGGEANERLAIVGRLRPGSRERAREIIAAGPPYELNEAGFRRHSILLAEETVVFVFEGSGIEALVSKLIADPAASGSFSVWGPLLAGTPTLAQEEFNWEAG